MVGTIFIESCADPKVVKPVIHNMTTSRCRNGDMLAPQSNWKVHETERGNTPFERGAIPHPDSDLYGCALLSQGHVYSRLKGKSGKSVYCEAVIPGKSCRDRPKDHELPLHPAHLGGLKAWENRWMGWLTLQEH